MRAPYGAVVDTSSTAAGKGPTKGGAVRCRGRRWAFGRGLPCACGRVACVASLSPCPIGYPPSTGYGKAMVRLVGTGWRSAPLRVLSRSRDRRRGIEADRAGSGILMRARVGAFFRPGPTPGGDHTRRGPGAACHGASTPQGRVRPRSDVGRRAMVSSAAAGGIAGGGGAYPRRVSGTLILCAGPIGNLGDTSARLSEVLRSADIVYAEDTRRSAVLLDRLDARRPLRSFFVGNEKVRSAEIAQHLQAGETVALLTDAGMPGISDPGLSAVRAAVSVGANVTGIPGPSAVTLALALSGLPADRFVFEGFLPRRGAERSRRLDDLASEPRTSVVFCSPRRLAADVADLTARLGRDRPVVVCREMTKPPRGGLAGEFGGSRRSVV